MFHNKILYVKFGLIKSKIEKKIDRKFQNLFFFEKVTNYVFFYKNYKKILYMCNIEFLNYLIKIFRKKFERNLTC